MSSTSWFPISVIFLLKYHPSLTLVVNKSSTSEKQKQKKNLLCQYSPPALPPYIRRYAICGISSTSFALKFRLGKLGIQENGSWPKEESSLAMPGECRIIEHKHSERSYHFRFKSVAENGLEKTNELLRVEKSNRGLRFKIWGCWSGWWAIHW